MTDETKTLKSTALYDAMPKDVFRDEQSGELMMVVDAYDVPSVDLEILWSNDPDLRGKIIRALPVYHKRAVNFVRLVPDTKEEPDGT